MIMISAAFAAAATLAPVAAPAPAPPPSGPIDLFCRGRGDRFVNNARSQFETAMRIKIAGDTGQALVPDELLADDDARGWHDLKKLVVSGDRIDGKINFSWIFAPVFSIDRATGVITMTGSLANFSGTCRPFDPRTSRMPAPRPHLAGPGAPQPGVRNDWTTPARPGPAVGARQRTPGSFVLAKYKGGANWYPAQVMRATGNLISVQYASGIEEALPSNLIYDLNWKVGTYIECKLAGSVYTPVTITAMRPGYAIDVVTNAGRRASITMRVCRTVAR